MSVLYTYDFTGSNGALDANWTVTNVGTGSNFDLNSNQARAQSATASGSTIAVNGNTITASGGVDVTLSVYKTLVSSTSQGLTFGIQHSGSFTHSASATIPYIKPGSGIGVQITPTGGIFAFTQNGTTSTYATPINAFLTMSAATLYKVRIQYQSGNYRVKAWLASNSEPATWNVDEAVPGGTTIPNGKFWMSAKNVSGSATTHTAWFDDVVISDAPTVVNGGYTAQAITASTTAPTAVIGTGNTNAPGVVGTASATIGTATISAQKTVSATGGALTATATMVNAFGAGNLRTLNPSQDVFVSNATVNSTATTMGLTTTNDARGYFKFDFSNVNFPVTSATLTLKASEGFTLYLTEVTSAWDESTITYAGRPSEASTSTALTKIIGNGTLGSSTHTINITSLANAWATGATANNGFKIHSLTLGVETIATKEHATASLRPSLSLTLSDGTVSTVAPVVGEATAVIVSPSSVTAGASYAAQVGTATATLVAPSVSTTQNPDASVTAQAMTATAAMPGGNYSAPTVMHADALTADAVAVNATVTAEKNAVVGTAALTASATIIPPLEAQVEDFDPYFLRLHAQMPAVDDDATYGSLWFRLDELAGILAENRLGIDGLYVGGVTLGSVFGPENRRAIHLDGTGYVRVPDNDYLTNHSRMEVVFRTSKATQTIATGSDFKYNLVAGNVRKTGLEMAGGKIRVYGGGNTFTGRTRLDDNQWHHVVWTMESGLSTIYIDGKLEMRRLLVEGGEINAIIDGIGGGPDFVDGAAIGSDTSMYFVGDIMEFVFDKDAALGEHDIVANYYAAFGIVPVSAGVMSATAVMTEGNKGKGNRKRALGLWYSPDTVPAQRTGERQFEYNWTGLVTSLNGVREPHLNAYANPVPFDMGEFKVFPKNVQRDESLPSSEYLGGRYYDAVTGEPRYLDVAEDLDTSEYDMVFFINLPPRLNFAAGYGDNPSHLASLYEDLINAVRDAQDEDGFSIWSPQPEVALQLGIINDVRAHSMRRESLVAQDQGNALGLYDPRSAQVNPWDGSAANGRFYYDNHALNRYRVVGLVEGLTDLGGYIDEEFFFGRPRDPFKPSFFGWKYADRTSGLQIGDEFMYGSQDEFNEVGSANYLGALLDRFSVLSVPPDAVLAGTVVTRENAYYYAGTTLTENPYRDYATTIVVSPGESVKGRPVNGKIFVNFMEGQEALGWTTYTLQMVPPNDQIPNTQNWEDSAKRAWGYSSYRTTIYAVTAFGQAGEFINQEGTVASADGLDPRGAATITGVNITEQYPMVSLRRYGMAERGLHWLADREERGDGDAVIRVGAMAATVASPAPVVVAERDADIGAQAAVATARIVKPANVADPDVVVNALPLVARADMTGYGKNIAVAPMTATAEIVENFDMVFAGGEQIVLTLLGSSAANITLYLKEDA